jgi:hypothetical protein
MTRIVRFAFDKSEAPASELTAEACLKRRREYERLHPSFPKWEGANTMSSFQKDASPQDQINGVIKDLRTNVIGKNVATLRAKRIHDDHLFQVGATDASGKPLSDAQQWVRWTQQSPQGARFSEALKAANESTQDETDAEVRRQAAADGIAPSDIVDKRSNAEPIAKKETPAASPAYLKLEQMAETLRKRLKAERNVTWSTAQCFSYLATNTDGGKRLMKEDRAAQLGPSFG